MKLQEMKDYKNYSEEDFRTFWSWGLKGNNATTIVRPEEYKETKCLLLACTQIDDIKPTEQKKLVKKWCEILTTLEKVEYLTLCSRVPQDIFESVCLMPNLVGLNIKWSGIKDISSIVKLKNIRNFNLGSSTQVESIDILGEMSNLTFLRLENIKKISAIEVLSKLKNLIALWFGGSVWTTQIVETLEPLRNLQKLQFLSMSNLKTKDNTIKFLAEIKSLRYLTGPSFFPKGFDWFGEYDYLRKMNPELRTHDFSELKK
jgi:Leucine-rich repeat (LRR) protein